MNKEEFIKKRIDELKGIPKYAGNETARRAIATSEWEASSKIEPEVKEDAKSEKKGNKERVRAEMHSDSD